MMKFDWWHDKRSAPDSMGEFNSAAGHVHGAWLIPTVDEVDEVLSPMYADTVLQILRGQGIYHGYDCERHCDNEVSIPSGYLNEGRSRKQIKADVFSRKWIRVSTGQLYKLDRRLQKFNPDNQREKRAVTNHERIQWLDIRLRKVRRRLDRRVAAKAKIEGRIARQVEKQDYVAKMRQVVSMTLAQKTVVKLLQKGGKSKSEAIDIALEMVK